MAAVTALARRFIVDVDVNYPSGPATWVRLIGISDLKPTVAPNMVDVSDYDSDGWDRVEKTHQAATLEITFFRKKDGGVFNPAQEKLRATEDKFGDDARGHVRWYDKDGGDEAYDLVGLVEFTRATSGVKDVDSATAKISSDGPRTLITNPLA